ncbi:MAG: hypothetical protein ACQEP5_06910 [Actinomycetota bacterium]
MTGQFFRCELEVSLSRWMGRSELFLGLCRENDPSVIFEIMGCPYFSGMPPKLEISEGMTHDYFMITFAGGRGQGGVLNLSYMIEEARKAIEVNTEL